MNSDENVKTELNELSPGFPGKVSYSPPEGYFDQLPDRVMIQWQTQQLTPTGKAISLRRMITAAAVVSAICFGVAWWTHQSNASVEKGGISSSDALEYILDNVDEFEPLLLQQAVWNNEDPVNPSDASAVEEYLLEELDGDDIETIF